MLIADLIKDLQKLQDEYPDNDVTIRHVGKVDRVEVNMNGVEIVTTKSPAPFEGNEYKFKRVW